jgi:hypothetical protein
VELVIADAKVRHGMHRAQRRGCENMLIQAILTPAAMNLRSWFSTPGGSMPERGHWRRPQSPSCRHNRSSDNQGGL